jgi:cell division protein FtsZ
VLEDDKKNEITTPLTNAISKNAYKEPEEEQPYIKSEESTEEQVDDSVTPTMDWEVKTVVPSEEKAKNQSATNTSGEQKEVKRFFLDEEMNEDASFEGNVKSHELTQEEQQSRTQERMERIRNYTSHLNSAEGLNELEREPAFKRRKIDLDDNVRSSEDNTSRYEVTDPSKSDNNTTLRGTNSFLHDNVD